MSNSDLNKKTTEKLLTNLRLNRAVSILFTIVLVLFTLVSIYGLVTKENASTFIALFAVACSCWSLLPIPFEARKNIKTELKSRNPIEKI